MLNLSARMIEDSKERNFFHMVNQITKTKICAESSLVLKIMEKDVKDEINSAIEFKTNDVSHLEDVIELEEAFESFLE